MDLTKLFFWSDANNETGLPNIRGDELAGVLQAGTSQGALMEITAPQTIAVGPPVVVDFTTGNVVYDDLSFFDGVSAFIIPAGIERVALWCNVLWNPIAGARTMAFAKNGGLNDPGMGSVVVPESGSAVFGVNQSFPSAAIPVVAGDALELFVATGTGPVDVTIAEFALRVIR